MQSRSPRKNLQIVARDASAFLELLSELEITLDPQPPNEAFLLVEREGRLELRPPGEATANGIQSVFPPDVGRGGDGRNPLVRAFGKGIETIFDLSAGLGGDAYRLAAAGHRVVASERNPAVYAVLASGWASDRAAGRVPVALAERLEFVHGEGADLLARIDRPNTGVYLDPMYPTARRKKSLPRREIQVLRRLLGDEGDAAALVAAARPLAARVVVKRPHRAAPLVPEPSFEIATKLVRFDVYVNPQRITGDRS